MYDLRIDNALIHDGLGSPARHGSLAVSEGRIAAVGEVTGGARETVDAGGRVLCPGLIDNHTHYDAQITWDPTASPSALHGVTTVVMGNCGFTIAPCRPQDRDLVMRNLTHVEGMSLDALRAGIRWEFETFPQYLDLLERQGVVPNVACFVGHSSVRTYVLGADAPRRAATAEEVARMRALVLEALRAGACGFSTTTSGQHNGEDGIPMPSRLSDAAEMEALAGCLAETGCGTLMITRGAATPMAWLERLARAAGRPFLVAAILHNEGVPGIAFDDLRDIAAAQSRGVRLHGAVSCTPLVFEFTMREPYLFEGLASWKPAMALHGDAERKALYRDAAFRQGVIDETAVPANRLFNGQWAQMKVARAGAAHKALEGRTLAALAAERGVHPLHVLLDLALDDGLETQFTAALLNTDEEAVGRLLCDPVSVVSLSDAGAHLTFLCDAGFGLHFLGHWVRDRDLMPLAQGIRRLTSQPAGLFGIRDRGRLVPGAWADLMLFDPHRVGRGPARRVHDLPAGASRLVAEPVGVHGVWVNGQRIVHDDALVAVPGRPGRVLRHFDA